ncbi:MAG: DUF99 family protein [Candidatus Lokiarchaeota archaeon]|nr:DUF99 family protein [Candidatus Lokiarchaeota archaeon]
MIRSIKGGLQVLAIDDKLHQRGDKTTKLAFVLCQGTWLDKVLSAEIEVDGLDATAVVIKTLLPIAQQFRLLLTHGITTGGLNMVDIDAVHRALDRPVIAVTENRPEGGSLHEAIKHVPGEAERRAILDRAGEMHAFRPRAGETEVYFYTKGIDVKLASQYLKKFAVRSRLPECLLMAHKIATGL